MAVRIKLKRFGRRHQPHYRLTAVDHRKDRNSDVLEELGVYDPINRKEDQQVVLKRERIEYWLGVGAQPTEAVVAIFKRSGDWQQFTGDKTPSGIDPQPERRDREAAFAAALAEG